MFIPKSLIDTKPVTVTVQLPRSWMADYFVDWVAEQFADAMMANEGQDLNWSTTEGEGQWTVIFTRNAREG